MKNKNMQEVFNYCPNYDYIINFISKDEFTNDLIDKYKEVIFSLDVNNLNHVEKIYKFDKIMYQYIDDLHFKKQMKQTIIDKKFDLYTLSDFSGFLAELFDFDNNYVEYSYKNLENTVWV